MHSFDIVKLICVKIFFTRVRCYFYKALAILKSQSVKLVKQKRYSGIKNILGFPANLGVANKLFQLNLHKFIKYVGHSFVIGNAL